MAVSSYHQHFKSCQVGHFKSASIKAVSKTPTHQSSFARNSWFCFLHEYITTDDVCKQGGSEADSSTDSKDKVFTVG